MVLVCCKSKGKTQANENGGDKTAVGTGSETNVETKNKQTNKHTERSVD